MSSASPAVSPSTPGLPSPRARTVAYASALGLFAVAMFGSGLMDLVLPPSMAEAMRRVGLSEPLTRLLGAWKLLGVVAITVPGARRLKEWAYAGFVFDLTGAAVAHLASGDGPAKALLPLALAGLGMASWALRPESRRLD